MTKERIRQLFVNASPSPQDEQFAKSIFETAPHESPLWQHLAKWLYTIRISMEEDAIRQQGELLDEIEKFMGIAPSETEDILAEALINDVLKSLGLEVVQAKPNEKL